MGLFTREKCSICGSLVGALSRIELKDGFLCTNCIEKCSKGISSLNLKNVEDIKRHLEYRKQNEKRYEDFVMTKSLHGYMQLDENKKQFYITEAMPKECKPDIFDYKDILNFELVEDGRVSFSGGVGKAIVGGALLGSAGAIVGGISGKKKEEPTVSSMYIRISLEHEWVRDKRINLVTSEIKKNGIKYRNLKTVAEEIVSELEYISSFKEEISKTATFSVADEILKFKKLLDAEIITKEEFEAKKKQLLNL